MFTAAAAAAAAAAVSVALECDVMAAFVLVHNAWLALQCKHSVLLLVVRSLERFAVVVRRALSVPAGHNSSGHQGRRNTIPLHQSRHNDTVDNLPIDGMCVAQNVCRPDGVSSRFFVLLRLCVAQIVCRPYGACSCVSR